MSTFVSSFLIVRAIRQDDFAGLMALAGEVGPGMTTLKADATMLGHRLEVALASFAEQIPPQQRDYLFVMEDPSAHQIVGVCAIKAAVGLDQPFYNYRLGTIVHASRAIEVFSRMQTLTLSNDLTGCAELCSLYLHPAYRSGNNGRLLSKSRLLFMAQFPHLFASKVIAEMRGFQDADGNSPFWDSLGRHFFKMDFNRADDLSSLGKRSFIAELMPRHPVYVAYLSAQVQQLIGQVHEASAPARRLLEQEGMYYEGFVDIFDAGPVLQARISELRALRESTLAVIDDVAAEDSSSLALLVASNSMQDFRVMLSGSGQHPGHLGLSTPAQEALGCRTGDTVRILPLNPKKPVHD